jgi:hypothetical protein
MRRRILAMTLAFFLVGIPLPTRPAGILVLGVLMQASAAHFNAARASAGATVYDGDRLSTESEGLLQFRGAGSLLYLPGRSGVTLHRLPNGTQAHLRTGGLVFSSATASAMEILANDAFIRPAADVPTVAQVTLVGPKELQITARRGALEFSYHNETEKIAEGTSCRIFLDSPNTAASSFPQRTMVGPFHENKTFKIVIIVLIGWATEWAVHEALESPDRKSFL